MFKKKIKEIFIGSNNRGKLKEIADLLPKNIKIFSNLDFKISSPKETGKTFQQNSLLKIVSISHFCRTYVEFSIIIIKRYIFTFSYLTNS